MKFSQSQLRAHEHIALEISTLAEAIGLWWDKNWLWYEMARQSLFNAMREGRIDELTESQLAFVRFIKVHLRPHFDEAMSEEEVFRTEPNIRLAESLADLVSLDD